MSALRDLQHSFMEFLQAQSGDVATFVADDEALDIDTRLEIYRNAYSVRLKKSIETDHPVLGSYLGDDLFERMADGYIVRCPSEYPSLRDFGEGLPGYLACTEPFSGHPILAEIAGFEWQLLFSFDAADAACARVEDLQSITAQDWPGMRVTFHPSVCVFPVRWNSVESWQALKEDSPPPQAADISLRNWILWRGDDRLTQFRRLSAEGAVMFLRLSQGADFSEVCEALLEFVAEGEVSSTAAGLLLQWVEAGLVSELQVR